MGVLTGLQPEKVFYYFEEITKIPHGSGNVEQISNYLKDFAKKRNIEVVQDELKNIIMVKEASKGYEKEPTLIIQGHMDMVAVHKPELPIDMTKEPLKVAIKGDDIYAEGTSLGGDDGIAVAYALAILDTPELKHPRLEIVITVDEEVGMDGAAFIDVSKLQGKRLLNLDSEEEGIFLASCAGGAKMHCKMECTENQAEGVKLELLIGGLLGGHSGGEIHKERGNANVLMGRTLLALTKYSQVTLLSMEGGMADNAIPRECKAELLIGKGSLKHVQKEIAALEKVYQAELTSRDPQVFIQYHIGEETKGTGILGEELIRMAAYIHALPNGVQNMSMDIEGLVETSLNLGIIHYNKGKLSMDYAVRSSVESRKEALLDQMKAITMLAGGSFELSGVYPGWSYRVESPFRDKLVKVYRDMYQKEPKVEAIHAGLECGLLAGKIEGLDCISLGPDMKDIHTTEETLSISSTQRVWEYLVKVLETKEK